MEGARPAVPQDAERCAELCRQALEELRAQRGGPLMARREAAPLSGALLRPDGLRDLLTSPTHHVLVGTIEESVVGVAVGHVDEVDETTLGVVDGCYVEPDARGVGVGRALLDAMVGWFEASSCGGVDATALPGDRHTKNFFEASGFKARLLTLHRPLR